MPSPANLLGFRHNQWIYFFLFLFTNSLISYSQLPLEIKCALGFLGVVLPLYVAFRTTAPSSRNEKPGYLTDLKFSIPLWFWTTALLALVFLRFYKLESLFCWPTLDEGWNGTLALDLSKHWTWRFFYTFGQAPPLPVWCAAGLFKLGCSPAFSLWFPSAVVSLLTVFVGYFAARQFSSKSFSMICGGLLAFSYWPLFIGRFCHQGIWLPLWVCLVFFFWGGFQKAVDSPAKRNWALGLGAALGFGSFTFTPWLGVAGLIFLSIFWTMVFQSKKDHRNFVFFTAAFTLSLFPFFLAVIREGYGQHIVSLSPWGGWFHNLDFFFSLFKYFAVLVWGSFEKDPAYTPIWGGFLNPLLGAFFFWGLIEMSRLRRLGLIRWVGAAFLLFLLPGALSPNLESFRIAQVLPLLLFITALGIHAMGELLHFSKRLWIFIGLLAFTGSFDFNLLAAPYRNPDARPENFGRPLKSLERYRAYRILNSVQKEQGPGAVLTNFDTNAFNDSTLSIMSLAFPAPVPLRAPNWIAIFVNANYEPFLKKKFLKANWFWVGKGLNLENGGDLLGIIPISAMSPEDQENWIPSHQVFQKADLQRFFQSSGRLDKSLEILYSAFVKFNPFLESVYWDKRAAYEYEDLNYEEQLRSYQMAVTQGYPTADLYYKLGQLLLVKQHYPEAQEVFLKATQAPLDLTQAHVALEWLKAQPPINPPNNSK